MQIKYMAAAGLVFVMMFGGCSAAYQHATTSTIEATVKDKERVCEGGRDGKCRWLVMTDKMSFENTDALFHLKFSSTDLQSEIQEGETYTFSYYVWRLPFFSVYPNILTAQ